MDQIFFKVGDKGCPIKPSKTYPGDAGWDLYTSREASVPPNSFIDIHVDIWVAMPAGMWGMITGRSSTVRKHGLRVETGIIDNGYRGEMFVGVWNLSNTTIHIPESTRLAQFIPFSLKDMEWVEVEELPPSNRGTNAFGSSGR